MLLRCIILLLSGIPLALSRPASQTTNSRSDIILAFDQSKGIHAFRELLRGLPEDSLHAVLHDRYPRYQDGVFHFDRKAIDNVNDEEPPIAAQLMSAAAKLELVKRQDGGNVTSSAVAESTPVPESSSDEVQPSVTPSETVPQTSIEETPSLPSTDPPPVTSASSAEPSSPASPPQSSTPEPTSAPAVVVPVTSTDEEGNAVTSSIFQPGQVVTSTDSAGSQVVMTTPKPTTARPVTSVDAEGSTFITTITPSARLVTTTVVRTQTNAQGQPEVVTNVEVIEATGASAEPTGGDEQPPPADGTQTGEPSLQTGAAAGSNNKHWAVEAAAVLGGAAGIIAWLA